MPEIKHNFMKGKMNKDLDERLVPNGEYKDAVNIQVSTSEDSDVGTAQNILGNSLVSGQDFIAENAVCVGSIADEKNDKLYYFITQKQLLSNGEFNNNGGGWNISGGSYTGSQWSFINNQAVGTNNDDGTIWADAVGVEDGGSYRITYDVVVPSSGALTLANHGVGGGGNIALINENIIGTHSVEWTQGASSSRQNKIWIYNSTTYDGTIDNVTVFFSDKAHSLIVEYDSKTNTITPVLVDMVGDVLKFDENNIITGINVIDDMLFWTDNHSEPKKINIPRCIEGTDPAGTTHTKLINESIGLTFVSSNVLLEEKHIIVIRRSPRTAPSIELITGRNPDNTYSGIMRITTNPGGFIFGGENFQNASSLWVSSTNPKNNLYDFSKLTVGDSFKTNIETDINGDSGFTLSWQVGDTVVFKEFSGDTYDDVPPTPITDYTIKAKIIADGFNNFTDDVAELLPNGSFVLPNTDGSAPLGYQLSSNFSYKSGLDANGVAFARIEGDDAIFKVVAVSPTTPFVEDGVYKVSVTVSGVTGGEILAYIAGNTGYSFYNTNIPYWYPKDSGGGASWITTDGTYEYIFILNQATANNGANYSASAYGDLTDKFFLRAVDDASNNGFTGNIDNISIERQDVTDARTTLEVLSINGVPSIVPDGYNELRYVVDLFDEEEKIFESKFPRFAYRYQYEDKEYSTFSPFTQVAFLPGAFDYHPQKGYNLGMTNSIKEITIKDFVPSSEFQDVVAVDILYKDEASPNIYVIDTIKNNQSGSSIWSNNAYTITSESVKQVLPSNQLLRPWDAVPKKALAQEISGNRIIYGNYTQGFDLLKPNTTQEYYPNFNFSVRGDYLGLNTIKSIKSLREYQLGVVFVDKYGRETPVLSNKSGLDKVAKREAAKSNKMEVSFGDTVFPDDMKYFKFFVKETSGEYYNMTMDRTWEAGDGLVWLSFGSADINKIDIDTFLILKKGLESNELVTEPAKYKVLAIETEAPDYIKNKKTLIEDKKHDFTSGGVLTNIFGNTIDDAPLFGRDTFKMNYKPFAGGTGSELHNIEDGILYVEFAIGSVVSKRYRVTELTTDRDQDGVIVADAKFSVKLDKVFGEDINFICDDPNDGLNPSKIVGDTRVRFYKYTPENSSEFDGRFFVKVISDEVFVENTYSTTAETTQYRTTTSRKLYYMGADQALLHSESLTGQTYGVYADDVSTGGTAYTNENNFGRFAPFFRDYHYTPQEHNIYLTAPPSNPVPVGQYRFDDTTGNQWQTELRGITAGNESWHAFDIQNVLNIENYVKNADISGWSNSSGGAANRYGKFNDKGEQTKGHVWFIDGGPFSGNSSPDSNNLNWDWIGNAQGTRYEPGLIQSGNAVRMVIAMGGIYTHRAITSNNNDFPNFFNIGTSDSDGGWYSGSKFKDLVSKISPSVKFRFKEDPTGEVYTINASGVTHKNRLRWSDGDSANYTSGERPPLDNPANLIGGAGNSRGGSVQLSPNMTRGYNTLFTNDRTEDATVTWDPTNSNATGAIAGGLHLTVARGTADQTATVGIAVFVTDVREIVCAVNGGKHSITRGMILTSYGNVTLDGTFTAPEGTSSSTANSYEPLIISEIEEVANGFILKLTGYSSPILKASTFAVSGSVNLLKHKVFDSAPASGDNMVFRQPAMNGYSQYSVNRINAQNAFNETHSLSDPGVLAVGYTIEFLEEIEKEVEFPDNPAIWETEPKESTDLDIYYEASGYNPLYLAEDTKYLAIPTTSTVTHVQNPLANFGFTSGVNADINAVYYTEVADPQNGNSGDITGWSITITGNLVLVNNALTFESPLVGGNYINIGDQLLIDRPDGSSITVTVKGWNYEIQDKAPFIYIKDALHGPDTKYILNWHNCYSFGNGVESNRIRDTFNLPFIANGVKASTTLDEHPYEENLKYGLIYSGIYNGSIGMNNLNQFIAAEKISKDLNPTYGSIQRLKAGWGQGGDLITLCEDRVLKIMANKDALFNADGNPQLLSTNAVLGQAIPYSGEFGISKNPESFASEAYRIYFTDKVRGAVMRLSMDGLTPISNHGMKDWFRDNLKLSNNIIGSYDDRKDEYNLTLEGDASVVDRNTPGYPTTVSFKEDVKGWVSFKSFIQENGVSCANGYYTFANGKLWQHHDENADRNTFYNTFANSSLNVVLNDMPGSIKSYHTLGYEGSQSRVFQNQQDDEYYNLANKDGWYVSSIITNKEKGSLLEFIEKEGKWFNYIKGLESAIDETTDFGSFDIQGLGTIESIDNNDITIDGDLNVSLQTGDIIYVNYTPIETVGEVTAINDNTITVDNSGTLPLQSDYIFFVKNQVVNMNGLSGYYADAMFENNSKVKAELFAVGSEITESSK